ncbi:MAG: hypothetical protein GY789_07365 [Hyphomicrobiales bacterium]|nr:hypothetical protein [Hyphomicrobiales bacterium]
MKRLPWGYFSTPVAQKKSLDDARTQAPRLTEKELAGYCNWHHALFRGDRMQCIRNVQMESMFLEEININRNLSWQNNARHFFTISPLGAATDCHRTWETLLLGSVPIVLRSAICSLFADLPVCIVDNWREVTMEYLQKKRSWVLESEFDFGSLYLDWWKARIRGESALPHRKQKFQDFIDTAHQPVATQQLHAGSR